jgi:hypothetical protein
MAGSKQAIGYLVVVFLLGVALGAGGMYWAQSRDMLVQAKPKPKMEKMPSTVDWLSKELDLSQDQKQQLGAILDETRESYDTLWAEIDPKFEAARWAGREKIRAILNAKQKEQFEELVRRLDAKEKKKKEEKEKKEAR